MTYKQIIKVLKTARELTGQSMRRVAAQAGYDPRGLQLWEKEVNCPSLKAAIEWADVLGFEIMLVKKGSIR